MKVLKKGKWGMPWSMEAVCPHKQCSAKLLIEEGDVQPVQYSSRNNFYAICAICGTQIDVPSASLPSRVQSAVNKKRKYPYSYYD